MDETPKPPENKVQSALTHTGTIVGILTGLVAIAGFFGFHAASNSDVKPEKRPAESPPAAHKPEDDASKSRTEPLRRRGVGTVHLSGGFPEGKPMLAQDGLAADAAFVTVVLIDPANRKEQRIANTLVVSNVAPGELAGIWREGTRFLDRVKTPAGYIQLSGNRIDARVPVSPDGRLLANVVWRASTSARFTDVSFPGPVDLDGWTLPNGVTFGDDGTGEGGNTLPVRFSLDIPKPGEALGALTGDLRYAGGWAGHRTSRIEALSPDGSPAATWSCPLAPTGHPTADRPNATLDNGLTGIRVLFARG